MLLFKSQNLAFSTFSGLQSSRKMNTSLGDIYTQFETLYLPDFTCPTTSLTELAVFREPITELHIGSNMLLFEHGMGRHGWVPTPEELSLNSQTQLGRS